MDPDNRSNLDGPDPDLPRYSPAFTQASIAIDYEDGDWTALVDRDGCEPDRYQEATLTALLTSVALDLEAQS